MVDFGLDLHLEAPISVIFQRLLFISWVSKLQAMGQVPTACFVVKHNLLLYLRIVCICFHTTMVGLSDCNRDLPCEA